MMIKMYSCWWSFFSLLTWWVSTDVAGVSVWNVVFQQAHACAMLPAQTVFTLRETQVLVQPWHFRQSWIRWVLKRWQKPSSSLESWSHSLPPPHRYIALSLGHLCPRHQSPHSRAVWWSPSPPHSHRHSTRSCQWTSRWCYHHLQ